MRNHFIGVWKLISCERKFADGRTEQPYGEKPVGCLTYDKAGRMTVQMMDPARRSSGPSGVNLTAANASPEEIREAVGGFLAYFGTFDVDEAEKTVIHHLQACLVPSWVGTDLKRTYQFSGNRLILTAMSPANSTVLVWQKEAD